MSAYSIAERGGDDSLIRPTKREDPHANITKKRNAHSEARNNDTRIKDPTNRNLPRLSQRPPTQNLPQRVMIVVRRIPDEIQRAYSNYCAEGIDGDGEAEHEACAGEPGEEAA